jgi:hypothetical protein
MDDQDGILTLGICGIYTLHFVEDFIYHNVIFIGSGLGETKGM